MCRIALLHTWWFVVLLFLVVYGLNVLLDVVLYAPAGDLIGLVYFSFLSAYCFQKYLACREYHCLITGPGFLLAAVLMLLRMLGIFDQGYGLPYDLFGLAALLGYGLECRYVRRTGSRFRTQDTSTLRR